MSELKPCPMCGSDQVAGLHDTVLCVSCGLKIKRPRPLQKAIDAWNRRAELERKVEPWIPVSERMPDPWVEVRFYPEVVTEPVIDRGVFDNQGRCWYDEYVPYSGVERVEHKSVTHWQPITEPEEADHD